MKEKRHFVQITRQKPMNFKSREDKENHNLQQK